MYRAAARTTSPLSSSMVSLSASDRDTTRRFGRDRSCNYCATPCQTWRRSTLSTTSKARIQPCCFGNTPILGRSRAVCFPMCCARWLTRLLLHTLLGAGVLVQLPAASVHAGTRAARKAIVATSCAGYHTGCPSSDVAADRRPVASLSVIKSRRDSSMRNRDNNQHRCRHRHELGLVDMYVYTYIYCWLITASALV